MVEKKLIISTRKNRLTDYLNIIRFITWSKIKRYFKRTFQFAVIFSFLLIWPVSQKADAAPGTRARSAVLFEAESGAILYSHNPDERLPIASITKIMTALVVLENCNLNDIIKYQKAWTLVEGSSSGFCEGQQYTVRQILYALMLASGNDAAVALANHTAGSIDKFAVLMNEKAKELGMTNSSFKNPHGLDEKGHYSTASDMAKLTAAAMTNKDLALIASTKEARIQSRRFTNHNKLLWMYPDTVGVKTGYTSSAGRTLVTCARKNNMTLICVTLNDSDDWDDHKALFDWANNNYKLYTAMKPGAELGTLQVIAGQKSNVSLCGQEEIRLLVKRADDVSIVTRFPKFVYAEVAQGESAGQADIFVNGQLVKTVDVVFAESVKIDEAIPLTFWEKIKWSWYLANEYSQNNWRYVY